MPISSPHHCLTLSFVVIPSLILLLSYFYAQFPNAPQPQDVYPEDYYPGGAYVSLPFGRVILIHGLSIPSLVWKDVAPALASRGHRVLLYDLYGRGYSDAPEIIYDASLYATQLALIMQHVKWPRANIAGVSMGGGILAAFTSFFPDLVDDKVAFIAPTGLVERSSRTTKFMSSPFIQTSVFAITCIRVANLNVPFAIVRIQSAHLPGYNAAIASSLRDGPIRGLDESFEALGKSNRKILLIWGTADNTVPYKYAPRVQAFLPQSEIVTIHGGRHDLTVSHPETIVAEFTRFFGSK
ncbi:alpha/beta-hydrolase [Lactifluus volemus]|nr:alpha/beta-hydrolase [Lactifluus volemus]